MRKAIVSLFMLICALGVHAQKASNVSGSVKDKNIPKVTLYEIVNGRVKEIATSKVNEEGKFGFRFFPEKEGIYCVGAGHKITQAGIFKFYFKPGDELNLELSHTGYTLVDKNTPENKALAAWEQEVQDIRTKGLTPGGRSTFVDFFPEVEELSQKLEDIKAKNKTKNKEFNALLNNIVDFDFAYYSISFLFMPRSAHPSKEEYSDYYMNFNSDDFLTPTLLEMPYGDHFISSLMYQKMDLSKAPDIHDRVAAIPADVLKGQFVASQLENAKTYEGYKDLYNRYNSLLILDEQKQRAKAAETKLVDTKQGGPAYSFSFPDIDGKETALEDLKGKVVLVDMWATWCGPCRVEEPHWERLNEKFKDKPVAFVGVSTDQDKPAWEKYVKEKGLKGIQLHAGPANGLSEAYKVNAIPRYILIDKEGNLITADSPRPSNSELEVLLNEWVSK